MSLINNIGYKLAGNSSDVAIIDFVENGLPKIYNYYDVDSYANSYGELLVSTGLVPGETVGILADNCAAYLFLWLGALRAGLTLVPLNYKLGEEAVSKIMHDANLRIIFFDEKRKDLVPKNLQHLSLEKLPVPRDTFNGFQQINLTSTAVVLYTSGSTGMPKGVPMTQLGYNWVLDSRLRTGTYYNDRLLIAAPLFHINALGSATFSLAAGASMVLLPRFNAKRYIEAINRFKCTILTAVPAMLAMVVREKESLLSANFKSVRYVRIGSSPISASLFTQIRTIFRDAVITNSYGTTESGPIVFGAHPEHGTPPEGSVGWPMPDVEVKLIDQNGQDTHEGVLLLRTPANMRGYLNLPDKTREILSEDGWYFTGDIFRRDSRGAFWFVSRSDDMFVCGGENIYPQQVEQLLEKHPAVHQACVVPIFDDIKGHKPYAFVILRTGFQVSENELKQYVLNSGPAYLHPRNIEFLESFPLAGTNKIDRTTLVKKAINNKLNQKSSDSYLTGT
jgi:long-chain acyl-CoA synthetase